MCFKVKVMSLPVRIRRLMGRLVYFLLNAVHQRFNTIFNIGINPRQ